MDTGDRSVSITETFLQTSWPELIRNIGDTGLPVASKASVIAEDEIYLHLQIVELEAN